MAYDASQSNNNQQVASSTPLSQGNTNAAPTGQSTGTGTNPSTPNSNAQMNNNQNQGSTTGASRSNQPKQASSGMFSNVQNYVQRNQPQAQKMAQSVVQDFGKQSQDIRAATEQKKKEQQAALNAGQQQMQAQYNEANQLVQNVMNQNQANVDTQASQRFQQLMQGSTAQDLSDLNLSNEQMRSQALQNLANQANREQGRRDLMKETFGGRDYTRGQSALDNLILSGDVNARNSLIQGVQGQAKDVNTNIQDTLNQSSENLGQYRKDLGGFGERVSGLATGAQSGIDKALEDQLQAMRTQYGFGTEGQGDLAKLQESATTRLNDAIKYGSQEDIYNALKQRTTWDKGGNRQSLVNYSVDRALLGDKDESLRDVFERRGINPNIGGGFTGKPITERKGAIDLNKNLVLGNQSSVGANERLQDILSGVVGNVGSDYGIFDENYAKQAAALGKKGTYEDAFGYSGNQNSQLGDTMTYDAAKLKGITDKLYSDINAAKTDSLGRLVENKYKDQGITSEQLRSGEFLDKTGIASQEQANRMLALQNLLGKQTNTLGLTPESKVGQDAAFLEKLRKDLGIV